MSADSAMLGRTVDAASPAKHVQHGLVMHARRKPICQGPQDITMLHHVVMLQHAVEGWDRSD